MPSINLSEFLQILSDKKLDREKRNLLEKKCRQILSKALNLLPNPTAQESLIRLFGQNFMEDLTQEFLLKLYQYIPTLKDKKNINEAYLIKMAKNLILYILGSERIFLKTEAPIKEDPQDKEEEQLVYLDREARFSYINDYLKGFIIEGVFLTLKQNLKDKDWEVLCFYLTEAEGKELKGLSRKEKNVYYKRWERLKPKLKNLFSLYFENENDIFNYWDEIVEKIRSEICKKFDL